MSACESITLDATISERDRIWLARVYQSGVPQLTIRSIACGALLGGMLAVTNLYVGAKTGITLGTSSMAVVLSFVIFRLLNRIGIGREMGILENNMVQAIACSGGYMSSPMTASLGAYIVISGAVPAWWQLTIWLIGIAALGVVFAIPLKRWFINDRQMPFPEGQACGTVLIALHNADGLVPTASHGAPSTASESCEAAERVVDRRGARALFVALAVAGVVRLLQSGALLTRVKLSFLAIPEALDAWYYRLAAKHAWPMPNLGGIALPQLTIRPTLDIAMLGLGGLIGIRTCASLLIGATINYALLAPWLVGRGDIASRIESSGVIDVGFRAITTWSLWCGVAMITAASLVSFIGGARGALLSPLKALRRSEPTDGDPLADIELPRKLFPYGMALIGGAVAFTTWHIFGVPLWLAMLSVIMAFVLAVIAVNATAQTSLTPHGALGKLTQLVCGGVAPGNITANVAAAGLGAEAALQTSTFIQNLRPGYMVGAKPRLQAVGHLVGAAAGTLCAIAVYHQIFLQPSASGDIELSRDEFPFPAVVTWKAVAEILTSGVSGLPSSALYAALVGIALATTVELARRRVPAVGLLSPIGLGLAFLIPFDISLAMFAGAFLFWCFERRSRGMARQVASLRESICAGVVAGAAVAGIAATVIETMM